MDRDSKSSGSDREISPETLLPKRLPSKNTNCPKDPNCEICRRTKTTEFFAEGIQKAKMAIYRARQSSVIAIEASLCYCGTRFGYSTWFQSNPRETKTSQEPGKVHGSFLNWKKTERWDIQTILWNLPKLVQTYLGINLSRHHTDRRLTVSPKKARQMFSSRNVIATCATLRIYYGKIPYERRFGEHFVALIIPMSAKVEYHSITAKDEARLDQFGKQVLAGIFVGYALNAGGRKLEKYMLVEDREITRKSRSRGLCQTNQRRSRFLFPMRKWMFKLSGRTESEVRTSDQRRQGSEKMEEHRQL